MSSVLQPWVERLPMMQQTVLLTAVRGPDGLPKYHPSKWVLRWYRRCILLSAMDGRVLADPVEPNGGSFTGPSVEGRVVETLNGLKPVDDWRRPMDARVDAYLQALDEVPHHFQLHLMHAVEIVGYKHPDFRVRDWWHQVYLRLVSRPTKARSARRTTPVHPARRSIYTLGGIDYKAGSLSTARASDARGCPQITRWIRPGAQGQSLRHGDDATCSTPMVPAVEAKVRAR